MATARGIAPDRRGIAVGARGVGVPRDRAQRNARAGPSRGIAGGVVRATGGDHHARGATDAVLDRTRGTAGDRGEALAPDLGLLPGPSTRTVDIEMVRGRRIVTGTKLSRSLRLLKVVCL